jgi:hypothetical protein
MPLQRVDDSAKLKVHSAVVVIKLNIQYQSAICARIEGSKAKCSLNNTLQDSGGHQRPGRRKRRSQGCPISGQWIHRAVE